MCSYNLPSSPQWACGNAQTGGPDLCPKIFNPSLPSSWASTRYMYPLLWFSEHWGIIQVTPSQHTGGTKSDYAGHLQNFQSLLEGPGSYHSCMYNILFQNGVLSRWFWEYWKLEEMWEDDDDVNEPSRPGANSVGNVCQLSHNNTDPKF